jgi:protein TonB
VFEDRACAQAPLQAFWLTALALAVAVAIGCGSPPRAGAPNAPSPDIRDSNGAPRGIVTAEDSPVPHVNGSPADRRTKGPTATGVDRIQVGSTLGVLKKRTHVEPLYPAAAVAARVHGIVVIEARIDAEGRVESARVVRSIPLLDQAALDAVRQWRFEPVVFKGTPTSIYTTLAVNFNLPPRTRRQRTSPRNGSAQDAGAAANDR